MVNVSVEVVPIQLACHFLDSCPRGNANWALACGSDIIEVEVALVVFEGLEEVVRDDVEVGCSCWERWRAIIRPVCSSISNHKTFNVYVIECWVEFSLEVVLINLPGKVGHVDSSVALTRYKEFVLHELWEFDVPGFKSGKSILGLDHVVGLQVLFGTSVRPTDSSRALKPKHVGS